jgi:1-acyl-sn-glycerol-3-phosphate acyltransferase
MAVCKDPFSHLPSASASSGAGRGARSTLSTEERASAPALRADAPPWRRSAFGVAARSRGVHAAPMAPAPVEPLERRDPASIARMMPLMAMLERYHDVEVSHLDRMPSGAALAVGNHNGGVMSPDMFALMLAYWRAFGLERPAYGLMHDFMFSVPWVGDTMASLGAVPASSGNALSLLSRGAHVLVYPGGDLDAFKASSRKNEVIFGERAGFIRVALRARVPIVPVVSVGAHEGFHVITDGAAIARLTGLKRLLRLEVFPIALALPWGITFGGLPYVPVPVRVKIRVLEPISWPDLPPEAADDRALVLRCRAEVLSAMNAGVEALVAEGNFGRKRLRDLLG